MKARSNGQKTQNVNYQQKYKSNFRNVVEVLFDLEEKKRYNSKYYEKFRGEKAIFNILGELDFSVVNISAVNVSGITF